YRDVVGVDSNAEVVLCVGSGHSVLSNGYPFRNLIDQRNTFDSRILLAESPELKRLFTLYGLRIQFNRRSILEGSSIVEPTQGLVGRESPKLFRAVDHTGYAQCAINFILSRGPQRRAALPMRASCFSALLSGIPWLCEAPGALATRTRPPSRST